ncbi:MAG: DMT family transporter [Acidobacteria bacterium]|jgi:drug/metabolite transporter (DMT)-like permease|nr:MAG: DMT family transporter [Acidobacteriota bacterium]GIU81073.1 MAG: multidrug transporter [Pyrinomonadaceae bacterium]
MKSPGKTLDSSNRKVAFDEFLPHLWLITVQILFGTLPVIGKVVLQKIPAVSLVGFRVFITAVVLFIFQRIRGDLHLNNRRDYLNLFILSFLGVTFNQLLFIGGLSLTKASNTSLLAATIPIFTLAISIFLKIETLRLTKILGIFCALAGVLTLIDVRNASFSSQTTIGDILIVLNSLSYGTYVAVSKQTFLRQGAMKSITWIFIFASLVCTPLGLFSLSQVELSEIPTKIWLLVAYIAIFATCVPYILNAFALSKVDPSSVAVYIYLQPLIGFSSAVIFLGESISITTVLGAFLIFAGVFITTRKNTTRSHETISVSN